MLLSKLLTEEGQLAEFARQYRAATQGLGISLEYLSRVTVRVFFDPAAPDAYLGGFAVNDQAPFRYLLAPGEGIGARILHDHHLREDDLVEITAIWLARYTSPWRMLHRAQLYGRMIFDAWRTGRPVILGGSFVSQVQQQQLRVLPQVVYQGFAVVEGYVSPAQLYIGSRRGVWGRLVRGFIEDASQRQQRRKAALAPPVFESVQPVG